MDRAPLRHKLDEEVDITVLEGRERAIERK